MDSFSSSPPHAAPRKPENPVGGNSSSSSGGSGGRRGNRKLRDRKKGVRYVVSDSEDDSGSSGGGGRSRTLDPKVEAAVAPARPLLIPDSEDESDAAPASSHDSDFQEVAQKRRKIVKPSLRRVNSSSRAGMADEGSILRFTKPNVKNTNPVKSKIPNKQPSDPELTNAAVGQKRKRKTAIAIPLERSKRSSTKINYKEDSDADPSDTENGESSSKLARKPKDSVSASPMFSEFTYAKPSGSTRGRPRKVKQEMDKNEPKDNGFDSNKDTTTPKKTASADDSSTLRVYKRKQKNKSSDETPERKTIANSSSRIKQEDHPQSVSSDDEANAASSRGISKHRLEQSWCNGAEIKVGVFGPYIGEIDERPLVKRLGQVEKILSVRNREKGKPIFCVKESGKSYRSAVDATESTLLESCPQLLRHFLKRMNDLHRTDGNLGEKEDSPAFSPLFIKVDRIVAAEQSGKKKYYLVKWCGLSYVEATWELEGHLSGDADKLKRFAKFNSKASLKPSKTEKLVFEDGRMLRDYQERGVAWMDHNYQNKINCILADEMGLGKTMQSVAMLQNLRIKWKIRGPFLVIAPVSTLGHWQREVESLTDMNCVVYSGSSEDRDMIRCHEFYFENDRKMLKFNVLLTGFEILMKDQFHLVKQKWQYVIVDEAHRLKTKDSKTTRTLKQLDIHRGSLLLLTGTPVQNNTKEIFSLLNVLDPEKFNSEEAFLEKYGDIKNVEQVKDLQENILRPRLLRRMKEDVEKSIPLKEETIIWVELTRDQRSYYRAIYEDRIADLLKGAQNNNIPNLRNVAMELRKLCNHPFLCDGLEDDLLSKYTTVAPSGDEAEVSQKMLCQSSGKMLLIDKLLPMLKDTGHRVLIFSQFKIMLDVLEDYLKFKGYSFERIDGTIRGSDRQAAIDRYSTEGSDTFVFLLSTRAGGLGITLTAADTCIIYDSDWNPQNDLQAMARCHRIGQKKDVKIYRLITRNTYEQQLFECSSRKYGLDEAILGNMVGVNGDQEMNKNIESLLKHGAYSILKDEGESEAAAFHAQNIDEILEKRTQKRLIGGRGNSTFSVATFISNPDDTGEEELEEANPDFQKDTAQFWEALLPEACHTALHTEKVQPMLSGGRRSRGQVNYREKHNLSDDEEEESDDDDDDKRSSGRRRGNFMRNKDFVEFEAGVKQWSEKELKQLEGRLIMLGKGREERIMVESGLEHRGLTEVKAVVETLIQLWKYYDTKEVATPPVEQARESPMESQNGQHVPQVDDWQTRTFTEGQQPSEKAANCVKDASMNQGCLVNQDEVKGDCASPKIETVKQQEALVEKEGDHGSPSSRPPEMPPFVARAMNSQAFITRAQKNFLKNLQLLHEREVLAKALADGIRAPTLPRTKKLPVWWGDQEDLALMIGANRHGHRDFDRIRVDETLCFAARFKTQTIIPGYTQIIPGYTQLAMNADSIPIIPENTAFMYHQQMIDWPNDMVLATRLKKLIECLPNGLSEREIKKRAAIAEAARRRNQELRAMRLNQESTAVYPSLTRLGAIHGDPNSVTDSYQSQSHNAATHRQLDHNSYCNSRVLASEDGIGIQNNVCKERSVAFSPCESPNLIKPFKLPEGIPVDIQNRRNTATVEISKGFSSSGNTSVVKQAFYSDQASRLPSNDSHNGGNAILGTQNFTSTYTSTSLKLSGNIRVPVEETKGCILGASNSSQTHKSVSLVPSNGPIKLGELPNEMARLGNMSDFSTRHEQAHLKEGEGPKPKTPSANGAASKKSKSCTADSSKQQTLLGFVTTTTRLPTDKVNGTL